MNQGKLDVVKHEKARLNTDISGISELKWTGVGKFNPDGCYIYSCGQVPQKKWNSPHSQQKSPKCSPWVQSQKWQNDLSLFPRQTIQQHSNPNNPSHSNPATNVKEAEVDQFYEDLKTF